MLILMLLLAGGCAGERSPEWWQEWGDPASQWNDEEGVYQGPTLVDRVYAWCDAESATWTYDVFTFGWTTSGQVTVHRWYPLHREEHQMASVARGADAQWDHLLVQLAVVESEEEQEPGLSTALECDYEFLTWRVDVTDLTDAPSDCVVFGYDPDVLHYGDCRVFPVTGG
jgi:hypothetical protein